MGQRTCMVENCPRTHYASGYCNAHWRRWRRSGDPGPAEINTPRRGTCSFDGCDRDHSAKGFCNSHYSQHRKGRSLRPLNDRVNPRLRDANGRKRCSTCKQWKELAAFKVVNRNQDGLSNCCRSCSRDRIIRRRYGISGARYDALLSAQGGVCAICRGTNESGRSMAVDHDHSCCPGDRACGRCVRGLLCSNCNMGLGLFQEDAVRLRAAVAYLFEVHRGR